MYIYFDGNIQMNIYIDIPFTGNRLLCIQKHVYSVDVIEPCVAYINAL